MMDKPYNKAEADFFITVLKEEAREILWKVGSDADPRQLIDGILDELVSLAPGPEGEDDRNEEQVWTQVRERLLKAAYATRPYCIRCGTCCTEGSPTLVGEDMVLFARDIVKPEHVFTIRQGEIVYDNRTQQATTAAHESIKIREGLERKTCVFYEEGGKKCTIYEYRPQQCRRQECWNPETSTAGSERPLTRQDLFQSVEDLWSVMQRHEDKCSHAELSRCMARLGATHGRTVEEVLELLRYDRHVREFMADRLGLPFQTMELFFGRPLSETIEAYGLRVEEQPGGGFLLIPVEEDKEVR
ncbi:MAG: YkgJ family cysteine cluster protein [Desulfomonilaceae bacterium]|nr:YkgJ family cysteine cluster protein [Desulfomonilaceae bacterium]